VYRVEGCYLCINKLRKEKSMKLIRVMILEQSHFINMGMGAWESIYTKEVRVFGMLISRREYTRIMSGDGVDRKKIGMNVNFEQGVYGRTGELRVDGKEEVVKKLGGDGIGFRYEKEGDV
jgi:hypothetical protein